VKPLPFIGSMGPSLLRRQYFPQLLMHVYNELKDHPYGGLFIFKQPVVVLRDPELIKTIAVKDFEYFMDHRSIFPEDGEPVWSKGLFSLKGKEIHVHIFGICAIYFLLIYIQKSMYRPLRVC
jgi:cytochrome P450 family 9